MTYRISGLSPEPFRALFGASDEVLAKHGAIRVRATSSRGFTCRITLDDAEEGETLLLLVYFVIAPSGITAFSNSTSPPRRRVSQAKKPC